MERFEKIKESKLYFKKTKSEMLINNVSNILGAFVGKKKG